MIVLAGILVVLIALVSVYFLPRIFVRARPSGPVALTGQRFPEGFLWATGEDAYQHEGGNVHADWHDWERTEPRPFKDGSVAGACVDFYLRYESDFDLAQDDGHNAHRIGIEWSRVEPVMGTWDETAFVRYKSMLNSMKRRGFTVFVNLWHFTLPRWAAAMGGWESPEVMVRWEAYVRECAVRFGPLVDYWSTMIDAQIYALRGYFLGEIPPLRKDQRLGAAVYRTLVDAHAKAYHIIKKEAGPGARVGQIYFFSLYGHAGNPLDRLVCRQLDDIFNWNMLDAMYSGRLSISILGGPKLEEEVPGAKGTMDWLGVNYYYRETVAFSPLAPGFLKRIVPEGAQKTDMGWEIYPEGIYRLCHLLAKRYPGVPLIIAENGLADADDSRRPRFIVDHCAWVHKVVQDGLPLFGYTYWSLTDNLEWTEGFGPKFGLYRVDMQSFERKETRSARLYRFIAKNNRLPDEKELEDLH